MHSRDTVDLHDTTSQNIKLGNQLVLIGYTVACYSVMSTEFYVALQKSFWIYPTFGAFAGIIIFKAGLYFYDLIISKNKNAGKIAALTREVFAASIFVLAVVSGFLVGTVIGAISPLFYIVSQMTHILYHSITAIYMKYCAHQAKDPEERAKFQASFKRHGFNAAFFIIGTICLSLLAMHIPLLLVGIVNAFYNALCFTFIAYTAFKIYRENKTVDVTQKTNLIPSEVKQNQNKHFYYFTKNRESHLNEVSDAKKYLFDEIDEKVQKLTDEIRESEKYLFQQKNKRNAKILSLKKLKSLLEDSSKTIDDFNAMLKEAPFNVYFNHPFQSFFRKTGDTLDIFDAARHYLLHKKLGERENDVQYVLV